MLSLQISEYLPPFGKRKTLALDAYENILLIHHLHSLFTELLATQRGLHVPGAPWAGTSTRLPQAQPMHREEHELRVVRVLENSNLCPT